MEAALDKALYSAYTMKELQDELRAQIHRAHQFLNDRMQESRTDAERRAIACAQTHLDEAALWSEYALDLRLGINREWDRYEETPLDTHIRESLEQQRRKFGDAR